MKLQWINQWRYTPHSRDFTLFGLESSSFSEGVLWNLHLIILGVGVIWWIRR